MNPIAIRAVGGSAPCMGERDAEFTAFFGREYPKLVRSLYLVVHDVEHARDLSQEAFIQLFERWRRVSRYERPEAWVRRVGIRMAVRALRRERLRPGLERALDPAALPEPLDLDVLRAVRTLSPNQRAAVVLFYFEDLPAREVADVLGCTEATAKVHLHRARRRLETLLREPARVEVAER
jgi:RNA polymerase sigma-70 factor (ECF subfamily)